MESHSLERIKLDAPLRRTTDQTMSYQFAHDETDLKQRSDGRQTDMARKDRGALLAPEDLQADVSARRPKSRGEALGDAFAAQRYSISQRHHGMPQFMEKHAHEEHDGRQYAHEPIQQRRPVFKLGRIVTLRQQPG